MNKEKILPLIVIILCIGSGIFYLINGDLKKFLYWFSTALIFYSVNF